MNSEHGWPSRRLQIAAAAIVALCAAVVVLGPSFSREKRAEAFYLDGWFAGITSAGRVSVDDGARRAEAVSSFESALKLCPDYSLYQQALVWHYPKGKLPQLLSERKLSPQARHLAFGLIYGLGPVTMSSPLRSAISIVPLDEGMKRKLDDADQLKKLDPANSLPYYRKAYLLTQIGRTSEAAAEIDAGNRIGKPREYLPEISSAIRGSLVDPAAHDPGFADIAGYHETIRSLVPYANGRLNAGNVREARSILETCCRMGVNIATAEPRASLTFKEGADIYGSAWNSLKPVYERLGMHDQVGRATRLATKMETGKAYIRAWLLSNTEVDTITNTPPFREAVQNTMSDGASMVLYPFLIGLFWWLFWEVARRSRGEDALTIRPWGEGWLTRVFVMVYPLALVGAFFSLRLIHFQGFTFIDEEWNYLLPEGLIALGQVVVLILAIAALRHSHFLSPEKPVGLLAFLFRGPAGRQAWSAKYLVGVLLGQMAFLACAFLLITAICKPALGVYPWQLQRMPIYSSTFTKEREMIGELNRRVLKFCPADWQPRG